LNGSYNQQCELHTGATENNLPPLKPLMNESEDERQKFHARLASSEKLQQETQELLGRLRTFFGGDVPSDLPEPDKSRSVRWFVLAACVVLMVLALGLFIF